MKHLKPTFNDIENFARIYDTNEFFTQFINEEINEYADANALLLKYNPTLEEFKIIEKILIDSQRALNRHSVKIFWPENTGIYLDVLTYLHQNNYNLGKTLLMHALPKELEPKCNNHLKFKKVTAANSDLFNQINYQEDLIISRDYAEKNNLYYRYQLQSDKVTGLLAYNNQKAVGSVIIISSKDYLEVDNLLTIPEFRKQNVASTLLNTIKTTAHLVDKTIILKTDAEDYPWEIYLGMGFKIIASQISIKKDLL